MSEINTAVEVVRVEIASTTVIAEEDVDAARADQILVNAGQILADVEDVCDKCLAIVNLL